jgi:pyruvate dehydrogenase E2 component (dihydrolipoamide acetyltransferase)
MPVTRVVMPKLSEAMETGKVIKWLKREGDRVQGGDILAEVETDKADVEMEAFGAGVLRKILVPAGGEARVGSLIAVIAEPADDIAAVVAEAPPAAPAGPAISEGRERSASPAPGGNGAPASPAVPEPHPNLPSARGARTEAAPAAVRSGPAPAPARGAAERPAPAPGAAERPALGGVTGPAPAADSGRIKASPLARKIAGQWGIDLAQISGTGPGGRIVRRDVEGAAAAPASPAAVAEAPAAFEDIALSPMRAAIARRMPMAKAPVPHFYVSSEVAMDRAWALREELNALAGQPRISVNDLVVRACALALMDHPGVNASFQGDSIRVHRRAHIGIAVALEDGLITPVLRDCQAKSLARIALESRDLAERARGRKLRATELSGATFSVSNLGMYDVAEFSAIINPPEGAILAVAAVRRVPVVDAAGALAVGRRLMLTLSCDHRAMDGAMGARFLQDLRRLLEEPLRLLV